MKTEVLFPSAAVVCDFLTKLSDTPKKGILQLLINFKIVPVGSKLCVYFFLFFHFPKDCLTEEIVQILKFSSLTTQTEVEVCDSISR